MKILNLVYSLPPMGNFALESDELKVPVWDHCREQFASKFTESATGLYYSVYTNRGEDVAEFLFKCEELIGFKEEKSSFCKTDKSTIIWIQASKFWMNCQMKRSLLTVILRCGLNYNSDIKNFDEALFSDNFKENKWARETKSAVLRFFFGFTKWLGVEKQYTPFMALKHGWHEEFHCQDNSFVRQKLILPEGETLEPTIIGVESLWA